MLMNQLQSARAAPSCRTWNTWTPLGGAGNAGYAVLGHENVEHETVTYFSSIVMLYE